jgi:membrane protein YdbS with pleckstrin-like domain
MTTDDRTPLLTTTEVLTNVAGDPAVSRVPGGDPLYPPEGPDPSGTRPDAVAAMEDESAHRADQERGVGIEGETVVWEGRYGLLNFVGRIATRSFLTVAWIVLAIYTWGYSNGSLAPVTIVAGVVIAILWVALAYRILQACCGHFYRLTNRRLFVSTGLLDRRRDMMELLRVKDVFTRQNLIERWLGIGTVVVVSSDKDTPTFYLPGVSDPKRVMDLVWHHARAERDERSVKVEQV